jgi:hypothetical protein
MNAHSNTSAEGTDALATPAVGSGIREASKATSWEYFLRVLVVVLGMLAGFILAAIIALFADWIPFC